VTDCDLVLGLIDPEYFLGGRRHLDLDAARAAIQDKLAEPLGMSVEDAAAGVVRIVNSQMSDLIRREVVKSGHHPDDFVLYSFGGAGPVHAVGYARSLGIGSILVFPTSSVFSAFGIAMADLLHTRLATRYVPLPADPDGFNDDLAAIEEALVEQLRDDGFEGRPEFRRFLTMRFRRQTTGEEIRLPWDRLSPDRMAELERLFVDRYEELYGAGVAYRDAGIDVAGVRVDAIGPVANPAIGMVDPGEPDPSIALKGKRRAYLGEAWHEARVYDHGRLAHPMRLEGPAIVESPFTTIALPPGSRATVDAYHTLVIQP